MRSSLDLVWPREGLTRIPYPVYDRADVKRKGGMPSDFNLADHKIQNCLAEKSPYFVRFSFTLSQIVSPPGMLPSGRTRGPISCRWQAMTGWRRSIA